MITSAATRLAQHFGSDWQRNTKWTVFREDTYVIMEEMRIPDGVVQKEIKFRRADSNTDACLQFEITEYKKGRRYYSSFSVPKAFAKLFLDTLSQDL